MPDDNQNQKSNGATQLKISDDTVKKFSDIIELIKKSQSMNDEERQYWIDVLPIMTEDQLSNLKNILNNEKKQIEEAESEYKEGIKKDVNNFNIEFNEIKYKEKKRIRIEAEKRQESDEKRQEEALLAELNKI